MAFWVVSGGNSGTPHRDHDHDPSDIIGAHVVDSSHGGMSSPYPDDEYFRPRHESGGGSFCHWRGNGDAHPDMDYDEGRVSSSKHLSESVPIRNLAFLVIREGSDHGEHRQMASPSSLPKPYSFKAHPENIRRITSSTSIPTPPPPPRRPQPPPVERTESGLSISSDASAHQDQDGSVLGDLEAASLVREHMASYRRRYPDSQPERILRALISPKSRGADFQLDNDALRSIFSAANELFFASRLTRRVTWDWSHAASEQYESHIVGTTALRTSARFGGWETLIVLSSPILRDTKYNRRLLISTFLHEMMHSFMFVTCGLKAKQCGGHTEGFHQIAAIIDDWAGKDCLRLRDMEADLARWQANDLSFPDNRLHTCDGYAKNLDRPPVLETMDEADADASADNDDDDDDDNDDDAAWQWYEREDFGDRLQYVAQVQYVP